MSNAAEASTSLRERLKRATFHLHSALDSAPQSNALLSATVTRAEYIAFLKRSYGFMAPLEELVRQSALVEELQRQNLLGKPRAHLIESDLKELGDATTLERMQELPRCESIGHALGIQYVLEGSVMGGLMMGKHIAKQLGISAQHCGHFLLIEDNPKTVVQAFQAFVEKLNTFDAHSVEAEEAEQAAIASFNAIEAWFRRNA